MLTHEIMGVVALAILWVNTLLVVGAGLTPLGQLLSRLRRPMRRGTVTRGEDDGVLARHVVEQVGRRASDDAARQAILFHDRAYRSELAGGTIAIDDEVLVLHGGDPVEIWIDEADKRSRAASPTSDFDDAYRASRRAKGYVRDLESPLCEGDTLWVADATSKEPAMLASFDPRSWLRKRVVLVLAFQVAMIAISALATFLALYPPVFGTVSIAGGVLGLLHFLVVMQPLGVTVREICLLPHEAIVRGSWVKSGSEGSGASAQAVI